MAGVWSTTEMSIEISSFELMTYIKQVKMCGSVLTSFMTSLLIQPSKSKSKENLYVC